MLFVLIACKSYSQSLYSLPEPSKAKYSAQDSIITDRNNKTINLYGAVEFAIDGLTVNADQVFFDQKNRRIIAKGLNGFTFNQKIEVLNSFKNRTLTYTIGNDTVFIE